VYDGECPICTTAAQALEIRKSVGRLHIVDARTEKDHPLLNDISDLGFDLDEGMVLKYGDSLYHGRDALHMMAMLGSGHGWFNRMNALLFRSRTIARFCYPAMRAVRNFLIGLQGKPKIRNLLLNPEEPIFAGVFGQDWNSLPPVFHQHYAIRPFSKDRVELSGTLDVHVSLFVRIISRLTGMLVPFSGSDVPVTVIFISDKSGAFRFDRRFQFPNKSDVIFQSRMVRICEDELIEFMRFGFGWRFSCIWDGQKVMLNHRGYVWRILGLTLPIPMSLIIGKGYAEEEALSDDRFRMYTHALHPLFGKTFGYTGEFTIRDISCDP